MSTNSTITVRTANNERKSIYCHWDGYPSYNGKILLEHYNTLAKAKALVKLGWLSILNENIAQPKGEVHTFDKPFDNVNIYYGRDRGDENCEAITVKNCESMEDKGIDRQEYNYYFDGKKWYLKGKVLTLAMCED